MMKINVFYVGLLFYCSTPIYALDKIKITEKEGLFNAYHKTVPIITAHYVGWLNKWAGIKFEPLDFNSNRIQFSGSVKKLNLQVSGHIQENKKELIWNYLWQANNDYTDAKGFGIEFNLKLDSASFLSKAYAPKLLPDNKGWQWQAPNGQSIEVIFSPALAHIQFVTGKKNKIRAYIFSSIHSGSKSTKMTVKVGDHVNVVNADILNYSVFDSAQWHKNILPVSSSPIDLSFLNQHHLPAGRHGFVKRKKDQLVFDDGTATKFWGANLQAYALFKTPDKDIKQHAKRISQLGFNLVRIHHHDSTWVKPNIFKNPTNNTLELSNTSFEKLDWWIKCLKEQGIYIWLDLHVGREVTKNDEITYFDDFSKGKKSVNIFGFSYYNDSIQSAMQKFNENYLNHKNKFTHLRYKDDPAVIALLITNENDVTHHFGNALLPRKGVPIHNRIFSQDVKDFSLKNELSYNKTWRTWEMGESKIYLNDVEHRFNKKMIHHLQQLGTKSLIATTNSWGRTGLFSLPALTDSQFIDVHTYRRREELGDNPRYLPSFLSWGGAAQVTGFPLSISEWNSPLPSRDRFTAPLFTASIANLQGWDMMTLFGYSNHAPNRKRKTHKYSSYNDPAIMGLMPAAALLYRQNHVAQANKSYELKLPRNDFFFNRYDPRSSKTIRTLLETSRFTIAMPLTTELPWLKEHIISNPKSITVNDLNKDFIPTGQNFVVSDTGELKRDWITGIHTINTEKSQIASGWIGGKSIQLDYVTLDIKTKKAVIAVQSLENKAIINSKKIFITLMARSKPSLGNKLPFLSEPILGKIYITAMAGLRFYPINNKGEEDNPVILPYKRGRYEVSLLEGNRYHWGILKP